VRAKRVADAIEVGYGLASYVSSKATTWPGFECGYNCFILEYNNIQPFAKVGNNVTLWSCNHIGHHAVVHDDCFLASGIIVSGDVTIGRGCFVGVNATIRDGIKLGERCVLGAGAIVLHDMPDETVLAAQETPKSAVPSSRLRSI
jgi:acetyltransferase-like isoleucine patch superfamily enzyme